MSYLPWLAGGAALGYAARRGRRAPNGGYRYTLIGGDPEWDEPGWPTFWQGDPNHYQWQEVQSDYFPAPEDAYVEETLLEVLNRSRLLPLMHSLELQPPYVVFADLSDENHLARFVDGTENGRPIFLVDPTKYQHLIGYELHQELLASLLHESGHAYLRLHGVEYSPREEALVEKFARSHDPRVLG
jgi:hypothetical protein